MADSPAVLFLVGPTAVGKSKLALSLARRLKGEIISADSMQIYKGMDIGTAKPTSAERRAVRHHLIDILEPTRTFSAHHFRKKALQCLRGICRRGRVPIVVGGSGLYVRALLSGLAPHPGADSSVRRKLEKELKAKGLPELFKRLERADPKLARSMDAANPRRVLRALEIWELSRKKPSDWNNETQPLEHLGFKPVVIGLRKERGVLYEAIERRVERMFQRGLLGEVKRLAGRRIALTARQALGYRELYAFLRDPQAEGAQRAILLEKTKEKIKQNTRRYAKRQMTWFKREAGIHWLDADSEGGIPALKASVLRLLKAAGAF